MNIKTGMDISDYKSYSNSGNNDVLKLVNLPGTVLDVGCGAGDNARILLQRGCVVDGITISQKELETAKSVLNEGFIFNLENGLPPTVKEKKYDYIICSHVLEHICYPNQLLADILHCLEPHGKLIVALPNLFHYKSRWQLIKGNFNYESSGIWDNTHFKWYSYRSGAQLLEANGFNILLQTVTGQLPCASLFSKFLSQKQMDFLFNGLSKISPGLFGYQLLFLATVNSKMLKPE